MITVVMIICTEFQHDFLIRLLLLVKLCQTGNSSKTALSDTVITDLHCVLEAVVELHLNAPVFRDRVQDHPQEQLPHALENSADTMRHPHVGVYQLFQEHPWTRT